MTKKIRTSIPQDIAAELLFISNRTCCVCTIPGKPIQIHHIDECPSNNTIANLVVLCLDCHNDTMLKGGFGRKLDASQVKLYKDEWVERVRYRKDAADQIASIKTVIESTPEEDFIDYKSKEDLNILVRYLNTILTIHKAQWMIAQTKWDDGTTYGMKQGSYQLIDFYEEVLIELATFYPPNHFGISPSKYFSELIGARYNWYNLIYEPYGRGTGGTMVGVSVAGSVMNDLLNLVQRIASELIYQFELESKVNSDWSKLWLEKG